MADNLGKKFKSEDEKAIREVVDRWMSATKTGDGETILDLMCDDAVFTVPDQDPFGKEAFAKGFQHMADMDFDGTNEIVEIEIFGDYGFTRNLIEISLTQPDGQRVEKRARTLTIFKREKDGNWRLYRDANLPA